MSLPPLMSEQERDASVLFNRKKAGDFSEPGGVKTRTALEAASKVGGKVLVVAPPIALRMWRRVGALHLGLDASQVAVHAATEKSVSKLNRNTDIRLFIVSSALSPKPNVAPLLEQWSAETLILDEAHAYARLTAQRTLATYGKGARGLDGLAACSDYVFPLTGSPILSYSDDVYPHLKALRPDILDYHGVLSFEAFKKQFCVEVMRSYHPRQRPKPVVIASKNDAQLRAILYGPDGFAVRRKVAELSDMPPLLWTPIAVPFMDSPALREATAKVEDPEQEGGPNATMRRLLGAAKAPHVATLVEELLESGDPILVMYWHTEVGEFLEQYFRALDKRVARIGGSTPANKKAQYEDELNAGSLDVLVGQIASMGVSLNLQERCSTAVFAEYDWSPGVMDQAVRRLWRTGQRRRVTAYLCTADHPGDDAAQHVLGKKLALSEAVNG